MNYDLDLLVEELDGIRIAIDAGNACAASVVLADLIVRLRALKETPAK